jgi:hypothetical protein
MKSVVPLRPFFKMKIKKRNKKKQNKLDTISVLVWNTNRILIVFSNKL